MMPFSCKQQMCKKANGAIVRWSNRATLHHHVAYYRTIFIALSCRRYRTIALLRHYTIACRTIATLYHTIGVIAPSRHCSSDPLVRQ